MNLRFLFCGINLINTDQYTYLSIKFHQMVALQSVLITGKLYLHVD